MYGLYTVFYKEINRTGSTISFIDGWSKPSLFLFYILIKMCFDGLTYSLSSKDIDWWNIGFIRQPTTQHVNVRQLDVFGGLVCRSSFISCNSVSVFSVSGLKLQRNVKLFIIGNMTLTFQTQWLLIWRTKHKMGKSNRNRSVLKLNLDEFTKNFCVILFQDL